MNLKGRYPDDSLVTLIATRPTNTDVKSTARWFISPHVFSPARRLSAQFPIKRLPVYNTIFVLDQPARHLQLSDLTLASL